MSMVSSKPVRAPAQVGDRIEAVSASFGTDVWEAKNFGQVMYAIKTRNGEVYIKFRRNYGDTSFLMVPPQLPACMPAPRTPCICTRRSPCPHFGWHEHPHCSSRVPGRMKRRAPSSFQVGGGCGCS